MKNKRKENIKKTITKSKTLRIASSISKIKVRYNYHPNIGDYKEPFNESKMRLKINEILNSFSSYNDKSKSTAAKLIKEENLKNAKENIIISLREDLEYHKKINRHCKWLAEQHLRKSVQVIRHPLTEPERNAGQECRR